MSRGGRGGFGRGRGGGPGGASALPIGVTFADLQAMSREATPLYPPLDPMPVLSRITDHEREMCRLQVSIATRLRTSAYYVVGEKKADELERYSDQFKPTARARPTLRQDYLNKDFFPLALYEAHFNPRKRLADSGNLKTKKKKQKIDWSMLGVDENAGEENEDDEDGENRAADDDEAPEEDYDEENDDNDYEIQYFDNGEEENDDLGDGGGDGDGGGEDAYD